MKARVVVCLTLALLALLSVSAQADWQHDIKWDQMQPRNYYGEESTITDEVDALIADDFLCAETCWITGLEFLGSLVTYGPGQVDSFRITFWTDVPATSEDESHPGQLLYDETFGPADPGDPLHLGWRATEHTVDQYFHSYRYKLNIPEHLWFLQEGTSSSPVVYWVGIQGIGGRNAEFFWAFLQRQAHPWGGDAAYSAQCFGIDPWANWGWEPDQPYAPRTYEGARPYGWLSANMAFSLSGVVPEPTSLGLLCLIGLLVVRRCARRRAARPEASS